MMVYRSVLAAALDASEAEVANMAAKEIGAATPQRGERLPCVAYEALALRLHKKLPPAHKLKSPGQGRTPYDPEQIPRGQWRLPSQSAVKQALQVNAAKSTAAKQRPPRVVPGGD